MRRLICECFLVERCRIRRASFNWIRLTSAPVSTHLRSCSGTSGDKRSRGIDWNAPANTLPHLFSSRGGQPHYHIIWRPTRRWVVRRNCRRLSSIPAFLAQLWVWPLVPGFGRRVQTFQRVLIHFFQRLGFHHLAFMHIFWGFTSKRVDGNLI